MTKPRRVRKYTVTWERAAIQASAETCAALLPSGARCPRKPDPQSKYCRKHAAEHWDDLLAKRIADVEWDWRQSGKPK